MASDRSPIIRTTKAIAGELGVSPSTVSRMVRDGMLPVTKGGRQGKTSRLQIDRKELDAIRRGQRE